MPIKINPCAKCGKKPYSTFLSMNCGAFSTKGYLVSCDCGRNVGGDTKKLALDKWNAANPKEDDKHD